MLTIEIGLLGVMLLISALRKSAGYNLNALHIMSGHRSVMRRGQSGHRLRMG